MGHKLIQHLVLLPALNDNNEKLNFRNELVKNVLELWLLM